MTPGAAYTARTKALSKKCFRAEFWLRCRAARPLFRDTAVRVDPTAARPFNPQSWERDRVLREAVEPAEASAARSEGRGGRESCASPLPPRLWRSQRSGRHSGD